MNENEILDNPDIEDTNIEVELDDLIQNGSEEILENSSLSDSLDENSLSEEIDSLDDIEELSAENELDMDLTEESETTDNIVTEPEEEISAENLETDQEDLPDLEENSLTDENDETELLSVDEDITIIDESEEQSFSLASESNEENDTIASVTSGDDFITDDLNNIDIEFGIEAKGFILSLKMMEAMIEKGYIFKDILNDKIFDAVMIFNGNLENTVMTSDIKIKIEDGKIQLIKG